VIAAGARLEEKVFGDLRRRRPEPPRRPRQPDGESARTAAPFRFAEDYDEGN
jgi:hypothetical protein